MATAAHVRTRSPSASGAPAQVCWERRASRSASANAIGNHLHSNLRPVAALGDCSPAADRHWKKDERGETAGARGRVPSSEGRSPADHPSPAVRIGCCSRYTDSRKWACRSFAFDPAAVKWTSQ